MIEHFLWLIFLIIIQCLGEDKVLYLTLGHTSLQTLEFNCTGDYLLHIGGVYTRHDNKLCETSTIDFRNALEGSGPRDFKGHQLKNGKEIEQLLTGLQTCRHGGQFRIKYQCLKGKLTSARDLSVIHLYDQDNYTTFLAWILDSFGFICSFKKDMGIVTIYDLHTTNPEYPFPIYCINGVRELCYKSQLATTNFNLHVDHEFILSFAVNGSQNKCFIKFEGLGLKCVPNLKAISEDKLQTTTTSTPSIPRNDKSEAEYPGRRTHSLASILAPVMPIMSLLLVGICVWTIKKPCVGSVRGTATRKLGYIAEKTTALIDRSISAPF